MGKEAPWHECGCQVCRRLNESEYACVCNSCLALAGCPDSKGFIEAVRKIFNMPGLGDAINTFDAIEFGDIEKIRWLKEPRDEKNPAL